MSHYFQNPNYVQFVFFLLLIMLSCYHVINPKTTSGMVCSNSILWTDLVQGVCVSNICIFFADDVVRRLYFTEGEDLLIRFLPSNVDEFRLLHLFAPLEYILRVCVYWYKTTSISRIHSLCNILLLKAILLTVHPFCRRTHQLRCKGSAHEAINLRNGYRIGENVFFSKRSGL